MRHWCRGNIASFQVVVIGSNPICRSHSRKYKIMPTYQYQCSSCGLFEVKRSMHETDNKCPNCEQEGRRIYGNVSVSFKGNGFYSTDNGRSSQSGKDNS